MNPTQQMPTDSQPAHFVMRQHYQLPAYPASAFPTNEQHTSLYNYYTPPTLLNNSSNQKYHPYLDPLVIYTITNAHCFPQLLQPIQPLSKLSLSIHDISSYCTSFLSLHQKITKSIYPELFYVHPISPQPGTLNDSTAQPKSTLNDLFKKGSGKSHMKMLQTLGFSHENRIFNLLKFRLTEYLIDSGELTLPELCADSSDQCQQQQQQQQHSEFELLTKDGKSVTKILSDGSTDNILSFFDENGDSPKSQTQTLNSNIISPTAPRFDADGAFAQGLQDTLTALERGDYLITQARVVLPAETLRQYLETISSTTSTPNSTPNFTTPLTYATYSKYVRDGTFIHDLLGVKAKLCDDKLVATLCNDYTAPPELLTLPIAPKLPTSSITESITDVAVDLKLRGVVDFLIRNDLGDQKPLGSTIPIKGKKTPKKSQKLSERIENSDQLPPPDNSTTTTTTSAAQRVTTYDLWDTKSHADVKPSDFFQVIMYAYILNALLSQSSSTPSTSSSLSPNPKAVITHVAIVTSQGSITRLPIDTLYNPIDSTSIIKPFTDNLIKTLDSLQSYLSSQYHPLLLPYTTLKQIKKADVKTMDDFGASAVAVLMKSVQAALSSPTNLYFLHTTHRAAILDFSHAESRMKEYFATKYDDWVKRADFLEQRQKCLRSVQLQLQLGTNRLCTQQTPLTIVESVNIIDLRSHLYFLKTLKHFPLFYPVFFLLLRHQERIHDEVIYIPTVDGHAAVFDLNSTKITQNANSIKNTNSNSNLLTIDGYCSITFRNFFHLLLNVTTQINHAYTTHIQAQAQQSQQAQPHIAPLIQPQDQYTLPAMQNNKWNDLLHPQITELIFHDQYSWLPPTPLASIISHLCYQVQSGIDLEQIKNVFEGGSYRQSSTPNQYGYDKSYYDQLYQDHYSQHAKTTTQAIQPSLPRQLTQLEIEDIEALFQYDSYLQHDCEDAFSFQIPKWLNQKRQSEVLLHFLTQWAQLLVNYLKTYPFDVNQAKSNTYILTEPHNYSVTDFNRLSTLSHPIQQLLLLRVFNQSFTFIRPDALPSCSKQFYNALMDPKNASADWLKSSLAYYLSINCDERSIEMDDHDGYRSDKVNPFCDPTADDDGLVNQTPLKAANTNTKALLKAQKTPSKTPAKTPQQIKAQGSNAIIPTKPDLLCDVFLDLEGAPQIDAVHHLQPYILDDFELVKIIQTTQRSRRFQHSNDATMTQEDIIDQNLIGLSNIPALYQLPLELYSFQHSQQYRAASQLVDNGDIDDVDHLDEPENPNESNSNDVKSTQDVSMPAHGDVVASLEKLSISADKGSSTCVKQFVSASLFLEDDIDTQAPQPPKQPKSKSHIDASLDIDTPPQQQPKSKTHIDSSLLTPPQSAVSSFDLDLDDMVNSLTIKSNAIDDDGDDDWAPSPIGVPTPQRQLSTPKVHTERDSSVPLVPIAPEERQPSTDIPTATLENNSPETVVLIDAAAPETPGKPPKPKKSTAKRKAPPSTPSQRDLILSSLFSGYRSLASKSNLLTYRPTINSRADNLYYLFGFTYTCSIHQFLVFTNQFNYIAGQLYPSIPTINCKFVSNETSASATSTQQLELNFVDHTNNTTAIQRIQLTNTATDSTQTTNNPLHTLYQHLQSQQPHTTLDHDLIYTSTTLHHLSTPSQAITGSSTPNSPFITVFVDLWASTSVEENLCLPILLCYFAALDKTRTILAYETGSNSQNSSTKLIAPFNIYHYHVYERTALHNVFSQLMETIVAGEKSKLRLAAKIPANDNATSSTGEIVDDVVAGQSIKAIEALDNFNPVALVSSHPITLLLQKYFPLADIIQAVKFFKSTPVTIGMFETPAKGAKGAALKHQTTTTQPSTSNSTSSFTIADFTSFLSSSTPYRHTDGEQTDQQEEEEEEEEGDVNIDSLPASSIRNNANGHAVDVLHLAKALMRTSTGSLSLKKVERLPLDVMSNKNDWVSAIQSQNSALSSSLANSQHGTRTANITEGGIVQYMMWYYKNRKRLSTHYLNAISQTTSSPSPQSSPYPSWTRTSLSTFCSDNWTHSTLESQNQNGLLHQIRTYNREDCYHTQIFVHWLFDIHRQIEPQHV